MVVTNTTYKFVKQMGFDSIINYVNTGEEGTADLDRLNTILTHMFNSSGWKELPVTQDALDLIIPSTQFRYLIRDDDGLKFRTGGFFINFYRQEDDPDLTDSYVLYASHVKGVNRTVQLSNLYKVYIKEKKKKKIEKLGQRVIYPQPVNFTNFPVCMVDRDGNTVTVYYAASEYKRKRFMQSSKFQRAKKNGWEFEDN